MNITRRTVIAVFILAVGLALASLLLPLPAGTTSAPLYRLSTVYTTLYGVFYFSAAIFFIFGVRGFKKQTRFAYALLAVGIMLIALTYLQVAVITALNLWNNPIIASGVIDGLPYILAGPFLYVGVRKFARLIGVRSLTTSFIFTVAVAVGAAFLATFLPSNVPGDATTMKAFNAVVTWIGTFCTLAAVLAWQVRAHIGALYTRAMAWLFLGLALSALEVWLTIPYSVILAFHADWVSNAVLSPLTILVSLAFLKASLVFNKTRDY